MTAGLPHDTAPEIGPWAVVTPGRVRLFGSRLEALAALERARPAASASPLTTDDLRVLAESGPAGLARRIHARPAVLPRRRTTPRKAPR